MTVQEISMMKNVRKGIPQVFFSFKPYSSWNFDITMRTSFKGIYSTTGIFGLATDYNNFILGYVREGYRGIAKIRDGIKIILIEEADASITEETYYDLRFWHRDGVFGLEYKTTDLNYYPTRGSQCLYEWTTADGIITMPNNVVSTLDEIYHTGFYQYINPPKFRTTGFRSEQTIIPVMPLDIDPEESDSHYTNEFPSSGTVDIEGRKFTYTGKTGITVSDNFPLGPTQLRNFYEWVSPFNADPDGSYKFSGGNAIEITEFQWLPGSANYDMYHDAIIASSSGYAWKNNDSQWKVWITTGGAKVNLLERSRHYSTTIPDYTAYTSEKIYITNGLTGVTPVPVAVPTSGDGDSVYPEGSFVFLDSDDWVLTSSYFASNCDHDNTISDLLDRFCKVAGTKAVFGGDIVIPTATIWNTNDFQEIK